MKDHRPATRPESELPIRLLALDIDGTIIGHDFRISDRTVAAIRGAVARGVRVSLATGRMPSSAVVYANRLGLTDPIIGHQGALVRAMPREREPVTEALPGVRGRVGEILHHEPMSAEAVREAIEWCRANGLDPHVNTLEELVVWQDDPSFDDYSTYLGEGAHLVPDLVAAIDRPMTKVISVGEPPLPTSLYPVAKAHFAGRADATLSHPRFLEFVAPGVSKGRAVAWLAHEAGIPMSQVMAIGDAFNDLEMIGDAGHGAAMASAPPEVRLAARYIAAPIEEDGSAALIEQLILADPDEAAANAERLAAEAAQIQERLRETAAPGTWGLAERAVDP
ncbi:MAG TPA: Cof-type HAD-IIB family hydrolase [Candidatus Limnocylindrales bacterium]|nr:Cof-type HAD-IIB family hydrolase [Candidatus Limnocylindrales bacterium]